LERFATASISTHRCWAIRRSQTEPGYPRRAWQVVLYET
jgi:hypothetical protein